jgi:hypothetical protein
VIKEHDRVALMADVPTRGLKAGDVAVVVMVHGDNEGYELEVFAADGHTVDVVTVTADQVRALSGSEILSVRPLSASTG